MTAVAHPPVLAASDHELTLSKRGLSPFEKG
jgi:hypothetical protein